MENLIIKNNTTTSSYDISASLNKRVQSIYKGVRGFSEVKPIPINLYPAVCVEIDNKIEEFIVVGNSASRDLEINFSIVPIVHYGAGIQGGLDVSDTEIIRLTQNIENMLRQNISASGTVESLEIINTDFATVLKSTDTYNSVSRINVLTKLKSRS
jgi:hypothetical protein